MNWTRFKKRRIKVRDPIKNIKAELGIPQDSTPVKNSKDLAIETVKKALSLNNYDKPSNGSDKKPDLILVGNGAHLEDEVGSIIQSDSDECMDVEWMQKSALESKIIGFLDKQHEITKKGIKELFARHGKSANQSKLTENELESLSNQEEPEHKPITKKCKTDVNELEKSNTKNSIAELVLNRKECEKATGGIIQSANLKHLMMDGEYNSSSLGSQELMQQIDTFYDALTGENQLSGEAIAADS